MWHNVNSIFPILSSEISGYLTFAELHKKLIVIYSVLLVIYLANLENMTINMVIIYPVKFMN